MIILGIETSCDETAVAVVEDGTRIVSNVVASSSKLHRKYGGIVPEVAARKQVELMIPTLSQALEEIAPEAIDAIAVTIGPGLIGSLLVGVETAKTLALAWNKPIIPVNHVHAHIYAHFIRGNDREIIFPAIALVASGGHTELFYMKDKSSLKWLGGTIDDAAGEAFDKTARLLGFENRGGPAIEAAASKFSIYNSQFSIHLPRPMLYDKTRNFSFSGLKTAVMREWKKRNQKLTTENQQLVSAFAYEIQEAITDVLVAKTIAAAKEYKTSSILLSGGVAANKRLRDKFKVHSSKFIVGAPEMQLCTDNGAAIASYAYFHNRPVPWRDITAQPSLSVEI